MRYLKIKQLETAKLKGPDLPFLKRYPFEHEKEFRLIYESLEERTTLDIPIPLSCIERITLSPWLPKRLSPDVKKVLWSISGCRQIDIARSTLVSNEEWKSFGESATKRLKRGREK